MGNESYKGDEREYGQLKVPYDLFTNKFGNDVADLFNIQRIPANEIVLKPKLLGLEQKVKPWVMEETDSG